MLEGEVKDPFDKETIHLLAMNKALSQKDQKKFESLLSAKIMEKNIAEYIDPVLEDSEFSEISSKQGEPVF